MNTHGPPQHRRTLCDKIEIQGRGDRAGQGKTRANMSGAGLSAIVTSMFSVNQ